jgi:tetratricopeptide (TPR) repeat protein
MTEIVEGVYLELVVQKIGTASTARTQEMKNYYLAKSVGPGLVEIQVLDMNDDPLPIREKVPLDDFRKRFTFQPDYLARKKKTPSEVKMDKAIAQAEAHVRRREYNSAEFEYNKALKLDEDNLRANFGIAKVYLATGETEKAREAFTKIAQTDAVFQDENKHIFNELGMELRKMGLHDQAVAHYLKALSFAQDDENLLFNIARAYAEKGDRQQGIQYVRQALALNPALAEAQNLLEKLSKPNS